MKQTTPRKKLQLDRATLRPLASPQLADARGGMITVLIAAGIYVYQSIKQGCGSDPQSDGGGCTTTSFSG